MDAAELRQIVEIFIQEADEALLQFEQCFLDLESVGPSDTLLDKIFRTAHNLKGSSAALGFSDLAEFTHHFETLLLALKKREIEVEPQIVSLLLGARDFINNHIECLRAGRKTPGKGEQLTEAMLRARDPKPKSQVIELPRPPAAGDIWFVGEDSKAKLFEVPQEPARPIKPLPALPLDPKLAAIQAEIERLTQLAASVNMSTVQAAEPAENATAQEVIHSSDEQLAQPNVTEKPELASENSAWSLASIERLLKSQVISETPEFLAQADAIHAAVAQLNPEQNSPRSVASSTAFNTLPTSALADDRSVEHVQQDKSSLVLSTAADFSSEPASTANLKKDLAANSSSPLASPLVSAAGALTVADESVKVNLARIDKLLNYVGELVILQSVLDEHRGVFSSPLLQKSVSQMSKIIREVQEISMGLRMVKLKPVFLKLQRIVRDTSQQLGKEVEANYLGDDTEIDKTVLDRIGDPLVHLVRNALDHGLETPGERANAGKPAKGQLTVHAYQQSRAIVIEVRDDGRGLDTNRIREKAIERGIITAFEQVSEERIRSFIFHPGFSTKSEVTDLSGRGVGLDVVASNVQAMQGRIEIESLQGQGTTFRILLPLTMAVVDGFVVKLGNERYVIPKTQVAESLKPHEVDVNIVQGRSQLLNLRGTTVPLFNLNQLLKRSPSNSSNQTNLTFEGIALVVMENAKQPFAVIVDDVLAQQQVVIKKLGKELQGLPGLSGAAILGDGKPAIILDLVELLLAQSGNLPSQHSTSKTRRVA
ncbi:chemotaxis protein CheA [bacterium]|nr:chemotaxis protein CheA [bacterium]